MDGSLPGGCGNMVFPYIAMQRENAQRYDNREALLQGTLFPGLDLPFRKELRSRFPQVNEALLELMALDFAIDELGLYLTTHPNDQQALELYWSYPSGQGGPRQIRGDQRPAAADGHHRGRLPLVG